LPDDDDSSSAKAYLTGNLIYTESVTKTYYITVVVEKVLYTGKTRYQRAGVVVTPDLGKVLLLDGITQLSVSDEYIYHDNLVHPIMLSHPNPRKVLIIGGGDGGTLREVLKYKSVEKAKMVELDPGVVDICKKYLPEVNAGAFDDPRTNLIFDDGRKYIETTDEKYDIVLIDLTDPVGQAAKLFTKEFYMSVKNVLNEGGGMATQSESAFFYKNIFATIRKTIATVFKHVSSTLAFMPSYGMLWAFTVASDYFNPAEISIDVIKARYERNKLQTRYYHPKMHQAMFILPKDLEEFLEKNDLPISTDEKPVSIET